MQVSKISTGLGFGRSLRNDEIEEFTKTVKRKKIIRSNRKFNYNAFHKSSSSRGLNTGMGI
ncbi:MAG: hypothetical protein ACLSA2_04350 [Candidatus Gastranaerophilaceae bacterium]